MVRGMLVVLLLLVSILQTGGGVVVSRLQPGTRLAGLDCRVLDPAPALGRHPTWTRTNMLAGPAGCQPRLSLTGQEWGSLATK